MDSTRLIENVRQHEELYNVHHAQYLNQQRRDEVWEEIGRRLNQSSISCRSQWTRIRDNYRKALLLRKSKSGDAASKIKPPRFNKELRFLTPYLQDEEGQTISPFFFNEDVKISIKENVDEYEDVLTPLPHQPVPSSPTASDTSCSCSRRRKRMSVDIQNQPTPSEVPQKYVSQNDSQASMPHQPVDPLTEFFINMARTVLTFPLQDQVRIKGELFHIVNTMEMRLVNQRLHNPQENVDV